MKRIVVGAVVCILFVSNIDLCVAQTQRSDDAEWAGIITGGVIAVGITAFAGYINFNPDDRITMAEKAVTYIPVFSAGVLSSLMTTIAFFDLFLEVPMHPVLAGVVGAGAGALEGAIIGASVFGTSLAMLTYFNKDFLRNSHDIYSAAWQGIDGGGVFGAMIGVIPGVLAGVLIALLAPAT